MFFRANSRRLKTTHAVLLILVAAGAAFAAGTVFGRYGLARDARSGVSAASDNGQPSSTVKVTGVGSDAPRSLSKQVDFSLFWEVWNDLKAQYYQQPVEDKTLFYGALRGLASSLDDPYTAFFEPSEAEDFSNALKGEFSGIGAEIGVKNGQLQIIAPLSGSPAEKAGIKPRDFIVKIDGKESINMPVDQAVTKIRGPKGTQVKLQLARLKPQKDPKAKPEYETLDVTITRDTIVVKSVRVQVKTDGLFVIEIHNFNADIEESFRAAVDEIINKGATGVVIDLRNDPGGYLDKAIAVAGEWLKDDIVVEQRERGQITEKYRGTGRGLLKRIPTVVLINEGSASAAEILAGALQDYGLAAIVGKKSFGKGSVQDYKEYRDGSAVKITIAEWLTPKGRSINQEGISPDVEINLTNEDADADRDPQLDKALELLRNGQTKPASATTRP